MLPEGVKHVYLRSDTAGYQHDLLKYCEKTNHRRFGRIEFAIGADVTKEFKKAVAATEEPEWKPVVKEIEGKRVTTGKEWAEVCFVPLRSATAKKIRPTGTSQPASLCTSLSFPGWRARSNSPSRP